MVDANGIGLAATQVGVLQRLFVFQVSEDETVALANPEIVERGEETDGRRRGLPLDPGHPRPGRAVVDVRSWARTRTEPTFATSSRSVLARRPARDRPPRRRADPRPHDARGAARGAREPAPAHRPRLSMARRIAVAATAPFGADVLERLAAEHDVVLLLTRPDKPRGRGRKLAAAAGEGRRPSGSASRSRSRRGSTTSSRSRPTRSSSAPTAC